MAADRDVRVLPDLPAVGPLLARAALPAKRPPASRGLPERTLMVVDHAQDAARLAAYDRLCGFTVSDAVPATWLHVLTFPLQTELMAGRDFPFALAGLVHVGNAMTLHRPVRVGDRLRLAVRAENLAPHRRGTTFDVVGEVHVGDEPAWTGRSTYLARGGGTEGDERPAPETGERPALPTPSQLWRLPADLGRRYAAVSGDVNPIHLHPLTARLFGFPRPIAHGMWTHARALAALGGRLPATYRAEVRFTKPILLPGKATFGVTPDDAGWSVAVLNSDGTKPYLTGRIDR